MKFHLILGWGIVIYASVALAWAAIGAYGFYGEPISRILELVALLFVCILAGRSLKFRLWKDILPYSIGWAFVAFLIDAFICAPSGSWSVYQDVSTWVGYILIIVLPLLAPYTKGKIIPHGLWET